MAASQLCPWSRKAATDSKEMKLKFHLTFRCHKIFFFLVFPFTSLKNVKTILCFVGQTKTGGGPDLAQKAKVC